MPGELPQQLVPPRRHRRPEQARAPTRGSAELVAVAQLQFLGHTCLQLGTLQDLDLRLKVRFQKILTGGRRQLPQVQEVVVDTLQLEQRGGLVNRILFESDEQRRRHSAQCDQRHRAPTPAQR